MRPLTYEIYNNGMCANNSDIYMIVSTGVRLLTLWMSSTWCGRPLVAYNNHPNDVMIVITNDLMTYGSNFITPQDNDVKHCCQNKLVQLANQ